ncbi:cytochrome P450 [Rhodococcus erythropolis]|uniref:cytochrome P450 n=1 Tax=Rhodococcus erythropolis TaxID=1833 RepID=UPI001BE5985B|nr:cytochrome P450 [Rhodococcus erythropolis]MBT2266050.1 cytochrome P450 [Rhodococcus erythropolis]
MTTETPEMTDPDLFAGGPPHTLFARLRETNPVMWKPSPQEWPEESGPGFWHITRGADIAKVIGDEKTYSAFLGGVVMDPRSTGSLAEDQKSFATWDPPRLTGPKRIVTNALRPKLVSGLEGPIRKIVVDRLNKISELGHCDIMSDFARWVTFEVILDLMGVPREDQEELAGWALVLSGSGDPEVVASYGAVDETRQASNEYMLQLLANRRAAPTDDFASHVATAEIAGTEVSDAARLGILRTVLEAAGDTTASTIAYGIQAFSQHPEQWQMLLDDRSLVPQAVEEVLRWASPAPYVRRTATVDTEVNGQPIAAGDGVVAWFISANRDSEVIDRPDVFDITRQKNPHFTFGARGVHQCPGMGVARLEIRVAFEELLDRMPDIRVDGDVELVRSNLVLGVKHMPVAYTPSKPRE